MGRDTVYSLFSGAIEKCYASVANKLFNSDAREQTWFILIGDELPRME